jgi:hypothetical protein
LVDLFVFPYSDDDPTGLAEHAILLLIALTSSLDLGPPELAVALGPRHMLWTSVPEAAVDKNRDPPAREDDVRSNGDVAHLQAKVDSVA